MTDLSDIIIHEIEQYTPEWWALRAGKFTGSIAGKLVTPTGRKSTTYRSEIATLIAEAMGWQDPPDRVETEWMTIGSNMEDEARKWFTVETGLAVKECGFIEKNNMVGLSPDGYVDEGDNGFITVEFKVPKPSTHIGWLLEGGMPKDHMAQVHFALAVTGNPHAYFMSYSRHCAPLLIKVERSDYTDLMLSQIEAFEKEYREAFKTITGVDYATL